jgi:RimJ/RimL family protein N-acetyltransferase
VIQTERLRLIPARSEHHQAMREGDEALGRLLGLAVADGWEGLPGHRDAIASGDAFLEANPDAADWWTHLFLHEGTLVGVGGFKGAPAEGIVEIGYALAPAWRGRGLALEAARGLMEHAFAYGDVRQVQAHTLAEENASGRILAKLGMQRVESFHDPDDGEVWRWAVRR